MSRNAGWDTANNITNVVSSCGHKESKWDSQGPNIESGENRGSGLTFGGLVGKSVTFGFA